MMTLSMNISCLTLPHLESLGTDEIVRLADKYGLDLPPGLDRVFIIEELLDYGRDISKKKNNTHESPELNDRLNDLADTADYPQASGRSISLDRYNTAFINVLIRDPLWALVCWSIPEHDQITHESYNGYKGYCLRVVPVTQDKLQLNANDFFTVTISKTDSSRYLGFPPDAGRCYKIELCVLHEENHTVLSVSRPFVLPPVIEPMIEAPGEDGGVQAVYRNPLAQLSGVNSFTLTHSVDRLPHRLNL
jgi:hypothetical protein